jgi:hypothetical protein
MYGFSGSRQFKDFEDYLMPAGAFDALAKRQELPVAVPSKLRIVLERAM